VLRSAEGRPFEQINAEMIFARHAGADMGDAYRFEDRNAFDGGYAYTLEIIHPDGSVERYGQVMIQIAERH
jgi:hypothetical protein